MARGGNSYLRGRHKLGNVERDAKGGPILVRGGALKGARLEFKVPRSQHLRRQLRDQRRDVRVDKLLLVAAIDDSGVRACVNATQRTTNATVSGSEESRAHTSHLVAEIPGRYTNTASHTKVTCEAAANTPTTHTHTRFSCTNSFRNVLAEEEMKGLGAAGDLATVREAQVGLEPLHRVDHAPEDRLPVMLELW